jgi:hypothetical protein
MIMIPIINIGCYVGKDLYILYKTIIMHGFIRFYE